MGKATLKEMREDYYLEDVYDMLEVISVDLHNRKVLQDEAEKKAAKK